MSILMRVLLLMATAGTLSQPAPVANTGGKVTSPASMISRGRPVTAAPTPGLKFEATQLEYYLSDEGIAYIRPGLNVVINSVTIGSDGKPVVDFNLKDDLNQPLDRRGELTPGPVSTSWILAQYQPETREYKNLTTRTQTSAPTSPHPGVTAVQGGTDSGGTYTELSTGHYTYKFGKALPSGYDPSATYTIGVYATRNLQDIIEKTYYDNEEYDFRPDGLAVTQKWDKIRTSACNQCHDPLALHGGSRRDVKLCALCHTSQTVDPDTGNTVDLDVMIHKIHMGENLPSVEDGHPYQIIGFGSSVHDYSEVAFPQDIRNCTTCHEGVANDKPAQNEVWFTNPTRRACGSCHDDIDWTTGANHPGGAQADDSACARCHVPDSGLEFDASIKGAHTVPYKSDQLAGLNATIVSVTNTTPGSKPTVTYKLTNDDGTAVDGNTLSTFSPILAGPNRSYRTYYRENAIGKATFSASAGTTSYTFTGAIPADATGSWTVSLDAYRNVSLTQGDGDDPISFREAAFNPVKYFAVTGSSVTPRRMVVNINNCNVCHERLALHGGQRMNTQECVICHNPTADDSSRRPADQNPPESISFQRLIHRIHSGEELTQDFTVYGFGGSVHNFNDVLFPGDRRNCAKCHVSNSERLPLPSTIDPVITLRDYFSPQGPGTAACLGCHDNRDAAAHAYLNTTTFGGTEPAEACATCHGAGKDWAVEKVHAR